MKHRIQAWAVALLIAATWSQSVAAQEGPVTSSSQWPDTRAGRMAAAFIEAFHAEDEEVMRRFMLENRDEASLQRMPIELRMAQFTQMREQLGVLEIGSVTSKGDLQAEVIVKSSKIGMWMSMSFALQEDEPHKLAHFGMRPSAAPEESGAKARFAEWEDIQQLATMTCKESGAPAVAIAVLHQGQIDASAVAGVRQAGGTMEAQLGDCFQMGSIGKAMTATMIGKLIDSGTLQWETTIADVLEDLEMRDEYRQVTLEQLLQHRGGLRSYSDDSIDSFPDLAESGRTSTEVRVLFARQALSDEPVSAPGVFNYSNAGYAVAALMAERVTDKSFEQLMQDLLFGPLQMKSARFGWPATPQHEDQPRGHYDDPPALRPQGLDEEPWHAYMLPAGGVSCSIGDLGLLGLLHLRGMAGADGALKSETIIRLHQPMGEEDARTAYASGWVLDNVASGEPKHWHSGSAGSFYASLSLYPESGLGIAVATNCAGAAAAVVEEVSQAIYARWTEESRVGR